MRHYCALQLKDSGLWHYTANGMPTGPCRENCAGHETADGACEHFRSYMLANLQINSIGSKWPKHKCEIEGCEEAATHSTVVPGFYEYHMLCGGHANKESAAPLIHVGEMWIS